MTYAHRAGIHDADSHLMEGLDWLREHADPSVREQLPDLAKLLGSGGAGADKAIVAGQRRIGDAAAVAALEQDVIGSAKGWMALGAMDTGERSRALDLLGFLFSSDYPHPEGTKDPIGSFERSFADSATDDAAKQRFYEDGYRELLGC